MSASLETTRLRGMLAAAYPRNGAKLAAAASGLSARTTERWFTGRATPSGEVVLRMAARCDRWAKQLEKLLEARRADRARGENAARAGETAARD